MTSMLDNLSAGRRRVAEQNYWRRKVRNGIAHLCKGPKRLVNESFKAYKKRRKHENKLRKMRQLFGGLNVPRTTKR